VEIFRNFTKEFQKFSKSPVPTNFSSVIVSSVFFKKRENPTTPTPTTQPPIPTSTDRRTSPELIVGTRPTLFRPSPTPTKPPCHRTELLFSGQNSPKSFFNSGNLLTQNHRAFVPLLSSNTTVFTDFQTITGTERIEAGKF
jgi:hypothetical protein